MSKLLVIYLAVIFLIGIVFASDVGIKGGIGIDLTPDPPINYSIRNVNSSDFWDDLDTSADIDLNDLGDIDTTGVVNGSVLSYDSILGKWIDRMLASISKFIIITNGIIFDFNETALNESIDLRTVSIVYNATNINTVEGTLDSGDINSIHTPEDGDSYNVSEDAGASPLLIDINFTGVTDFDSIIGRVYYDGGVGHKIQLEIQRSDTGDWENYVDLTDTTDFINFYVPVFDPEQHIFANGDVAVRFDHALNGIPSHNFYIDYLNIVDGWTALTVADHDGLGGRDNPENHPWALPRDGSKPMTGNLNMSGINITNVNYINPEGTTANFGGNTTTTGKGTFLGGITAIGSELIDDPEFDGAGNWTGIDWTISGGQAVKLFDPQDLEETSPFIVKANTLYTIIVDIAVIDTGDFEIGIGNVFNDLSTAGTGIEAFTITTSNTDDFKIYAGADLTLNSISVKEGGFIEAGVINTDAFRLGASTTANYILTADADGYGTWQTIGAGAQTPWTQNIDGAGYNLDDVGRMGIGIGLSGLDYHKLMLGSNATHTWFDVTVYSDTTVQYPAVNFRHSHSDTLGTEIETINGENLGVFNWFGVDSGNHFDLGADIQAIQVGASGARVPTSLRFRTANSGALNAVSLTIDESGEVGIGTTTPDEQLEVTGNIHLDDNYKVLFGTGKDASIYYDGVNMIINPKEVGSGQLKIDGSLNITERLYLNTTLKLTPVDTAPITCDASTLGSIYFDISEDQTCTCTSGGWKETDAQTAACV